MSARIKTAEEIEIMRQAGKILASVLINLKKYVAVGMTGKDVDRWVEEQVVLRGGEITYRTDEVNFPGSICISVNNEIVHGIPNHRSFKDGDVVSFDLVIGYKGMKVDSAFTMLVGKRDDEDVKRLLKVTEQSLYDGISVVRAGVHLGDVGNRIEKTLLAGGLGVVRGLVGHGIGHKMQEPPEVPNYGKKGQGPVLKVGDTIAIEPMATLGREDIMVSRDGWTITALDNSLAAHFEHTVLVTESGAEILTLN